MIRTLKEEIQDTGFVIRSDKCGVFYERRSENRWYKAKSYRLPTIEFNNENVKVLKRDEPYVYLGKPMTVAGETQDEVNQMLDDHRELLVKIELSVAPIVIKLEALEVIALAKISITFRTAISQKPSCRSSTSCIRKIFNLNHSTATRSFFQPKMRGGLGIRKLSIIYKATRIAHLSNMLNDQDINIKFIAYHSLKIDMRKRGVKHGNENNGFLGFAVKENRYLDMHLRGGFPVISDWPQLQCLTHSLDLSLSWEIDSDDFMQNGKVLIHHKTDDGIEISLGSKPRKQIQEIMLQKDLKEFKELKMQGTLEGCGLFAVAGYF